MSHVASPFPCFWNVCCLESSQQKQSVLQTCSTGASSVVDVDSKTTATETSASPPATAAVSVVASMHSYARPEYIGRLTSVIPRHKAVGTASREEAGNHESEAGCTVEHMVSDCCLNISLYCPSIWKGTELFFVRLAYISIHCVRKSCHSTPAPNFTTC